MDFRAMTTTERIYAYKQNHQIAMQTGYIGYLQVDTSTEDKDFLGVFMDYCKPLYTKEFKQEVSTVIHSLRFDEQYEGMLRSFADLNTFCQNHQESGFWGEDTAREYGFRMDTESYSFLMRCIPGSELYNCHCFCYRRDLLNDHMERAKRGIRFIGSDYRDLFYLADGDKIRVTMHDDTSRDLVCRYIDDYHLDVAEVHGDNIYHICEFAEKLEQGGYKQLVPLRSSLPELCYATIKETDGIVILKRGEVGYYKTDILSVNRADAEDIVDAQNALAGITKAQVEAMKAGSAFGFHVPAADPDNYKEDGTPIPLRRNHKSPER